MYTLLTSPINDAGDFLIAERGKQLLKAHSNEQQYLEFRRWEPLDDKLDEINKTKAIIICGGPGYARNFYPNIYPLAKNITDIKIPIIPFGLGWDGSLMYSPDKFSFSAPSVSVLRHIHQNCEATSCRDNVTREILNRHGFENVIMTGCPAWYDLKSIGKKFEQPREIHRVAVSMIEGSTFEKQNIELLQEIRKLLNLLYPEIELYAVFHSGTGYDKSATKEVARNLQVLSKCAGELDYKVVDAAYDASKLEVYRECDFHVGYRLHSHIFFLSIRKPTFLLQVDGRGTGLSETLGLPDVPAVSKPLMSSRSPYREQDDLVSKSIHLLDKLGIRKPVSFLARPLYRKLTAASKPAVNQTAIRTIMKDVETELLNGFPRFQGLDIVLDNYYGEMVRFLRTLP